ncbi:DUF4142 domain-containing protein [Streptomyces sp. LP05-1]|uniref:DUF4142 domain-containing protein n=1 Tax=Streptomyces pyxinae TaxID=2970734 RepID=A0ABT2CEC6_9ACTN|nr:DUF4142 domain-containing protein [Streptomyces sp. LP05-1]MCS0635759.1 DUF4142 domain-containing protein [Streptomyces sp. LP05-1]
MRRYPLAPLGAAAVLLGLCAPAAPAATPDPQQDRTFLAQSHQGNLAEIAAGKDAGRHATTACVKEVGRTLVRDHTKLDAAVRKVARETSTRLPGTPSAAQRKQLEAVRAKAGGPAYDTAWLKAQEKAHRQTLALIDQELRQGKNSAATAAARSARPVVAMHLDMVEGGVCQAHPHPRPSGHQS